MGEKRRFGYLDILKAIAMLCVCLYHYPLIRHTAYVRPFPADVLALRFFRNLNVVCVPLFMMVNGALILNRPFNLKKHAVRCASLFAGVYVWYVLTVVIGHAWQNGMGYVAANMKGILLSAQYLTEYGGIGTSHLWFVQMLVALYLLVPLIRAALDSGDRQIRMGTVFCFAVMGALVFLLQDIANVRAAVPVLRRMDLSGLETFSPMKRMYGVMAVYFVLGGVLHREYDRMLRAPAWLCAAMMAGGALFLFAEWYLVTIRTEAMADMVYGGYGTSPALLLTVGAFIAAAKLGHRYRVCSGKLGGVIELVGRNTLAVYYLHWMMGLTVLSWVNMPGCFAVNLIKAAVMVLTCSLAGEGIRRIPVLRRLV